MPGFDKVACWKNAGTALIIPAVCEAVLKFLHLAGLPLQATFVSENSGRCAALHNSILENRKYQAKTHDKYPSRIGFANLRGS